MKPLAVSPRRPSKSYSEGEDGFTLIELLVVIAIIAILASLLLTAIQRGKVLADSAACKNNLRQYGIALRLYTDVFDAYPPYALADRVGGVSVLWHERLEPYGGAKWRDWIPSWPNEPRGIHVCPSYVKFPGVFIGGFEGSYGYNNQGYAPDHSLPLHEHGLGGDDTINPPSYTSYSHVNPGDIRVIQESEVRYPSDMIAMGDGLLIDARESPPHEVQGFSELSMVPGYLTTRIQLGVGSTQGLSKNAVDWIARSIAWTKKRHGGRWNVVFCDAHVESLTTKQLCDPRQERVVKRWNRENLAYP